MRHGMLVVRLAGRYAPIQAGACQILSTRPQDDRPSIQSTAVEERWVTGAVFYDIELMLESKLL